MRIRLAVPDELDDQDRKAALDAALESVTRSNTPMIRSGKIPPAASAIKSGKVEWQPEPPGDEHFDLPSTMLKRGWGDCDDLAPWHAASLRASGVDPGARAVVRKSGPQRWHAVVKRSDGSIEDPSKAAGMGTNGHQVSGPGGALVIGAYAPIQAPMAEDGRLCLSISPGKGPNDTAIWFARCDVPDRLEPWDWSSMAASHTPAKALLHAITGCRQVAGADMDAEDQARLGAVNDLILGASPERVAAALHALMGNVVDADAVVGEAAQSVGFFGGLFKAIASPLTAIAKASHIPVVDSIAHAAEALTLLPANAALQLAKGKRLDTVALGQLKAVVSSISTLAPYVQTVLSVVPGVGTGISAGIGGALALAHGHSITAAMLEAVKSALPGGPLARSAFSVASDAMQGKPISQMAIDAIPGVPPAAKQALLQGLSAARDIARGKAVSEVALDAALHQLPAAAQRAVQIGVAMGHAKTLQQGMGRPTMPTRGSIPGLPGFHAPLMAAMAAGAHKLPAAILNAPRLSYDPGKVVRPWGPAGPAVMRF